MNITDSITGGQRKKRVYALQNVNEYAERVPPCHGYGSEKGKKSRKIAVNCAFWLQNAGRIWYNPFILRKYAQKREEHTEDFRLFRRCVRKGKRSASWKTKEKKILSRAAMR